MADRRMLGRWSGFAAALLCGILPACSGRKVVATHKAANGATLEIVEKTDSEFFKLFSLEVKSPAGGIVKRTALDLPYGYKSGFRFQEKEGEVVIEKEGGDLRYLTSYWLSENDLKKPQTGCPACAQPSRR